MTLVSVLLMMSVPTKLELSIVTWLFLNTSIIGKYEGILLVLQQDFDVVDCLKEESDFEHLVCSVQAFIYRMSVLFFCIVKTLHHYGYLTSIKTPLSP